MSNKDDVKVVGDENIREMMEMNGATETPKDRTEGDTDAVECVITTTPSTNNKKEDSKDGDVMKQLGKLTSKEQIQVRTLMIPFFMLLSKSSEGQDNCRKPCKDLKAHCFPVNVNPIDGKWIYNLMNHAANHPLKPNSGNLHSQRWGRTQ